jgi:HEAT repeat protein
VRSAGRCLHATGRVVVGLCLGGAALGCLPRAQSLRQRLEAYDPRGRIHAAGAIAEAGAVDEVPALIDRLDDEDVAVRLAAISALETLTATRLGYKAWAPLEERRSAVDVWRSWMVRRAVEQALGRAGQPVEGSSNPSGAGDAAAHD